MAIRSWTAFGNIDNDEVGNGYLYHDLDRVFDYEPSLLLVTCKHHHKPIIESKEFMYAERLYQEGGGNTLRGTAGMTIRACSSAAPSGAQ